MAAVLLVGRSAGFAQARDNLWAVPKSSNPVPHFEEIRHHKVLFVNGEPFTVLGVEIPWWDLLADHYDQDEGVYDSLYAKAAELGANSLKVPVKWSVIEPEKDHYDFSYVDHAIRLARENGLHLVLDWFGHYGSGNGPLYHNLSGEMYVPMYIVRDEKTYPRTIDGRGVVHHAAASYDSPAIIAREAKAVRALMLHLKKVDLGHVVVGIQMENEISVFGGSTHDPNLLRDHSLASNGKFAANHFHDDLRYSAWDLSKFWMRPLTEAAHHAYPIPLFLNYVNGSAEPGLVGESPGEDVATYLENCPDLSFIGVNAYFCAQWQGGGCAAPSHATTEELSNALKRFEIGRNIPAVTETNSGNSEAAPRFAYVAVGKFGAPIFAPWSLTWSYPEQDEPYVLHDGQLANGAMSLRRAYRSLKMALPPILNYAGTKKLAVFQAATAGESFRTDATVNGETVEVSGEDGGQVIIIHPRGKQLLIVGYRAELGLTDPGLVWPEMRRLRVERVRWKAGRWEQIGAPYYSVVQSRRQLWIVLRYPEAVLVSLP
jgi:hypothetical protein